MREIRVVNNLVNCLIENADLFCYFFSYELFVRLVITSYADIGCMFKFISLICILLQTFYVYHLLYCVSGEIMDVLRFKSCQYFGAFMIF